LLVLIPLDKKPGVCPIGIGDLPRRILAKANLYIIGNDIQLSMGQGVGTVNDQHHHSAAIGSCCFAEEYVSEKV